MIFSGLRVSCTKLYFSQLSLKNLQTSKRQEEKTQPVAEELAFPIFFNGRYLFLSSKDQLASMLGADESVDLPPVDQNRLGICINQAYRECYNPIDGRRPMWAQSSLR